MKPNSFVLWILSLVGLAACGCDHNSPTTSSAVPFRCSAIRSGRGVIISVDNTSGNEALIMVGGRPGSFTTGVDLLSEDANGDVCRTMYPDFQARWFAVLGPEKDCSTLSFGLSAPDMPETKCWADISVYYSLVNGVNSPTNFTWFSTNIAVNTKSSKPIDEHLFYLDPLDDGK